MLAAGRWQGRTSSRGQRSVGSLVGACAERVDDARSGAAERERDRDDHLGHGRSDDDRRPLRRRPRLPLRPPRPRRPGRTRPAVVSAQAWVPLRHRRGPWPATTRPTASRPSASTSRPGTAPRSRRPCQRRPVVHDASRGPRHRRSGRGRHRGGAAAGRSGPRSPAPCSGPARTPWTATTSTSSRSIEPDAPAGLGGQASHIEGLAAARRAQRVGGRRQPVSPRTHVCCRSRRRSTDDPGVHALAPRPRRGRRPDRCPIAPPSPACDVARWRVSAQMVRDSPQSWQAICSWPARRRRRREGRGPRRPPGCRPWSSRSSGRATRRCPRSSASEDQ